MPPIVPIFSTYTLMILMGMMKNTRPSNGENCTHAQCTRDVSERWKFVAALALALLAGLRRPRQCTIHHKLRSGAFKQVRTTTRPFVVSKRRPQRISSRQGSAAPAPVSGVRKRQSTSCASDGSRWRACRACNRSTGYRDKMRRRQYVLQIDIFLADHVQQVHERGAIEFVRVL